MVEQRANLDYGSDDTSLTDDLTHEPAIDTDVPAEEAAYGVGHELDEGEVIEDDVLADEENPEASTYGAP